MKLYVLPVERDCNATCPFCVNQFRNLGDSFLDVGLLEKCLSNYIRLDSIEISGGGEPMLHPLIGEVIKACSNIARTQMYTNGSLANELSADLLKVLNPLCISRAHYNSQKNREIMGIEYSDEIFFRKQEIKLSAVLYSGGIDSPREAEKYILWAKDKARKVVFRPLFEDVNYSPKLRSKLVPLNSFADYFGFSIDDKNNPCLKVEGIDVEFEVRSCSCENKNPILHANGNLNLSWDSK
jgi:organic radical activating enzyme